jgi:hypothetical protein
MGDKMNPTEQEQLIQRYYDGETIGRESELAENMLRDDPAAQQILEGLVRLSGNIQLDLDSVVAEEDFSGYWDTIQKRLPEGPPTGEVATLARASANNVVIGRRQRMSAPARPWLTWLLGPSLGAAAAVLAMALFVLPGLREDRAVQVAELPVLMDHTIDIESIESDGPLVMVMQENADEPAIIWFVESDGETEG